MELHVEQGPVLERAGAQIGVVLGVEGISWNWVEVTGVAAHAGPTPVADRRDALVAAARVILALRSLTAAPGVRATAGRIEVEPNAVNVVPGSVRMTADLRAPRLEALDGAAAALREACRAAGQEEGVEVHTWEFWRSLPTPFAPAVIEAVDASASEQHFRTHRLWAGAGHDAKHMADRWPAGMIFVPSAGGLSHNEREWTSPQDCARGATVLLGAVLRLAGQV